MFPTLPLHASLRALSHPSRTRAATLLSNIHTCHPPLPSRAGPRRIYRASVRSFASAGPSSTANKTRPASNPDRGPASSEDTQTDFNVLNVLGATAAPTTSIDECSDTSFLLDSGLTVTDGDGVMLIGGEAFVWRPWMGLLKTQPPQASETESRGTVPQIMRGVDLQHRGDGTGGVVTPPGVFNIPPSACGILALVWPKPDLLIIGTGASILPLERKTREHLQSLGVRIEVLDTRNAASQFNLLATERGTSEVAAAMVPCGFRPRKQHGS